MDKEMEIKNYEMFLQAKENLYLQMKLEEIRVKDGIKNGIAEFTLVKAAGFVADKIADTNWFRKVSNIIATASLAKDLFQTFKNR